MLRNKTLALILASALLVATTLPALAAPAAPAHERPESPSIFQVATAWLGQWIALPEIITAEPRRAETKLDAAGGPPGPGNSDGETGSRSFTSGDEDPSPEPESGVFVPPGG